ncbi:MAG: glutamate--tRNA ligase [Candidatus Thermoplasmatota archaeon]|nr:glutamate--tRNA ligase [Candidatus Thermoplasmatota archaeon]
MTNKIRVTAQKYALQNAVQFNGKADTKAVIGKVIAELRKNGFSPQEILPIVNKVISEVNKLSADKQISELEKVAPELLVKEKKERDFSLPPLPNAEKGKVVTRFPPEPNGYLHIGHAKASIVDYEYARMYNGKFIIRFDDTNPDNADIKFYDAQKEDLQWLGINWDEEYNTSSNLNKHYKLAEQLIKQGDAYVCICSSDVIKECRFSGRKCECRDSNCGDNLDKWKQMLKGGLDDVILRMKGDMGCVNTAMRDPTLFRIIETTHPIQGDKYRVWPTYDFAGAVEDSISGVTHPFRTKEYELRDEGYFKLLDLLGLRKPHLMEFARLNIEGMPVSKRKIKPLIDKGIVLDYDDIRLPTLRGLKKRGILPAAIKQFVFSQGISKAESIANFSLVESANRKILDPISKRYFFVPNPIKLVVKNAPIKQKEISFHPSDKSLGSRLVKTHDLFYISRSDVEKLKIGDIFRLKDLYNVKVCKKNDVVHGEYVGENLISDSLKIQWTTDSFVEMNVLVPHQLFNDEIYNVDSLETVKGYAEESVRNISDGEIVQFERFGFVRLEKKDDYIIGYRTHK